MTSILLALVACIHSLGAAASPITRHVHSTMAIEPRADPAPTGFFYGPYHHRNPQFKSVVLPEAGRGVLLLSVLEKGENVSSATGSGWMSAALTDTMLMPVRRSQTNVYAFPACNPPPAGSTSIPTTVTTAPIDAQGKNGQLMLLEDIARPENNDGAKLVKGTKLSILKQSKDFIHWNVGGMYGLGHGPCAKEAYTRDGKYTYVSARFNIVEHELIPPVPHFRFNRKQGSLFGPHPNPYHLIVGQNAPKELSVNELIVPLREGSMKGSTAIFMYDLP
ncbi:hypothetical protein QFC20_001340 [Naganishia adeliensis]|uniref:Uncharacterized protein n=1 Tax=Naganishia adeliensis TaxID=92952 RepID=A0ACC2WVA5_9TREE|nr:hypothetical protein QFC20_001340 [Naganishia adeliensis]